MHRVYLDNFDELERHDSSLAGLIKQEPSAAVLALRAEYETWGIPRHPKKAVERASRAEVQGAIVDGQRGAAFPKPEKMLKYAQLALLCLTRKRCSQKQMQVIAGGLVYICTFKRAILGSLNHIWSFVEKFNGYPPVVHLEIPALVKLEIARCLSLFPLAALDFRLCIDPVVTASDASTTGGGVTASTGLTNAGQVASTSQIRGDIPEVSSMNQVLTIGLFDGIGALRLAADSLQLPVMGHISVEKEASASRVLESRFPGTIFVDDVVKVDSDMVKSWACQFTQVGLILIGAGPPCQGVSGLNANRRGALKDHRSCLFQHCPRILALVQQAFPWSQVHMIGESVQSMDEADRSVMTEAFGVLPWALDAADVSLAHRPRLYWLTWEVQASDSVEVTPPEHSGNSAVGKIRLHAIVDPKQYLVPGWTKCSDLHFPTFTTSRPRNFPGRRPAGLDKLNSSERMQWEADSYRFPRGQSTRLPSPEEREVCVGFPKSYTQHCLPKSQQGNQQHADTRNSLVGNSWNVTVVCWLISQLAAPLGLCQRHSPQDCVRITAPGHSATLASFLGRPPMAKTTKPVKGGNATQLNMALMNQVSVKGEDILLTAQSEETLRYHRLRASLPSTLWSWRTICGWRWRGQKEHINVLELRAVLCALRWRITKQHLHHHKFIHLVDSLVCLHSLSRGRTSSRKLRRTLCKIDALLLASRNQGVWAYVHTSANPADAPSRRGVRRKWARK